MEGRQGMCRFAGNQGGGQWVGQSPSRSSRSSERSGYVHLPPHLQPLSDTSDEEAEDRRSQTVSLGSRSTEEWAAKELCGSRDNGNLNGQSYTELLRQGLSGDEGDGGLNLSFGLCSGRSSAASRTVIVNNHPDDDGGQVTAVARSLRSPTPVRDASENNGDPPKQQYRSPSVSRGASARPLWMQSLSPMSANSTAASRRGECGETDCGIADFGDARDGREVWEEHRRTLHPRREESVTQGVQRLCVREEENRHDDDEDGSMRCSSQTKGSPAGFGKRKSTKQQTFKALTECMEKHGALVASTMESNNKRQCSIQIRQCEAFEAEVEVQKKHYAAYDDSKLMCHALLEIAKVIRER
ncbi:hypothetical protein CBR_g40049 [Chara braunii]|uniref:Uncharacterized protein n=1 Tax=Chara braunii TaxID=69332 RepID=A0A388LSX0_CHABU|nr:hypothetical protein CBR_g40049 [Chara braunii]|eukprot:GBG85407.1 hypothetical protein CBR_g40049 [Chara braunii]